MSLISSSQKRKTGNRFLSRRFENLRVSLSSSSKSKKRSDPMTYTDEIPVAEVEVALVGVEHAGKSTFFKQITSMYTPEDFKSLVNNDGKSQAVGTLLKITHTLLKTVYPDLVTYESRKAADYLMDSLTLYSLNPEVAKAIKVLWDDVIFLAEYRSSAFFQPHDFLADVANCENLMDHEFKMTKELHLKLHNQTHGYNSTKFSFSSYQPVFTEIDDHASINKENSGEGDSIIAPVVLGGVTQSTSRNTGIEVRKSISRNSKNSRNSRAPLGKARRTSVLSRMSRSINNRPKPPPQQERRNEVRVFDIGGLYEKRTDWEYFLRKCNVPLFFCSLADYSTATSDGSEENLLTDSLNMFQVLCESDFLKEKLITIVLTKVDIFEQKLKNMKIPLNCTGQYEDAPSGIAKFDVEANIDYIKELFLRVTETENSFLTRENVSFRVINSFDDDAVRDVFVDGVNSIRAQLKADENSEKTSSGGTSKRKSKRKTRGLGGAIRSLTLRKSRKIPSQSQSENDFPKQAVSLVGQRWKNKKKGKYISNTVTEISAGDV